MLVYSCKKCKRFFIIGYENSYNDTFCSVACYKKYCENNNYPFDKSHIKEIRNALSN